MATRKPTASTGASDVIASYWEIIDKYKAVIEELVDDIESTGGIRLIGGVWAPVACPSWTDIATTYKHACEALGRVPVDYEYD